MLPNESPEVCSSSMEWNLLYSSLWHLFLILEVPNGGILFCLEFKGGLQGIRLDWDCAAGTMDLSLLIAATCPSISRSKDPKPFHDSVDDMSPFISGEGLLCVLSVCSVLISWNRVLHSSQDYPGNQHVAQTGLQLVEQPLLGPECWDYKFEHFRSPKPFYFQISAMFIINIKDGVVSVGNIRLWTLFLSPALENFYLLLQLPSFFSCPPPQGDRIFSSKGMLYHDIF